MINSSTSSLTYLQYGVAILRLKQSSSDSNSGSQEEKLDRQLKSYTLVIDDSADIAFMLVTILEQAGCKAVMAVSAREALNLAQREHFDLVISDISMPEMDGYALAKALRSLSGYNEVPMIAITGFSEYEDRHRALAAGFDAHVKKPIDASRLIELIEELFL
jgi:two-component system, chemotaxis family, CheB/CheR fusion protein